MRRFVLTVAVPCVALIMSALTFVSMGVGAQVIHHIGKPSADTTPVQAPTQRRIAPQEGHATLSGIVYDSLKDEPVIGATVIVAGTTRQAITDSTGMYHIPIDSIPEGTATVGFFLLSLDSIGITPPARQIEIHHGQSELLDLGVPSMRTVLRVVCRDSASDGRGMMMGIVRDAETDEPLVGALVVVQWTEMNIGSSTLAKLPKAVHTTVGARGTYQLCGLPNGVGLRAQARLGTKASGFIDVSMPPGGVMQRDFLVGQRVIAQRPAPVSADTGAHAAVAGPKPLGKGVLTGTVLGPDGKPLEGAQVYLVGTAVGAKADYRGQFRLTGLPAGTQTVEVRQLSFAPKRYTVDLSPVREIRLAATLDTRATVLGEVKVEGKYVTPVPGFDDRAKRGLGSFMTREDIEKHASILTTDLFRTVPGINVAFDGNNYTLQSARSGNRSCPMQWYLDGSPFDNSDNSIDQMLRPDDIEAIEIYRSASEVPVQFQGQNSSCGTVVVWSKRAITKKRAADANKSQ